MNYMFEIVVKRDFNAGGYKIPAGLSIHMAHDQVSNPLCSMYGKQRIAQALLMQYGVDLSHNMNYINTSYMDAYRM